MHKTFGHSHTHMVYVPYPM